jgi:general secretion pathway protein L
LAGRFLLLDLSSGVVNARIMTCGITPDLPGDLVRLPLEKLPDEDGNRDCLQAALAVVAQKTDIQSCKDAVVLLDDPSVWFRQISLPFTQKSKIAQVLPFELAPALPEEACVSDYLRHDIRFVSDQTLLLTGSVPESRIEQITECLKPYRIHPRLIAPKGYALAILFLDRLKQGSRDLIFIHMDSPVVTLILIAGGKPLMVRTLTASDRTGEYIAGQILRTVTGFRQRSGRDTRFDLCLAAAEEEFQKAVMADIESGLAASDVMKTSTVEWVDPEKLIHAIRPDRYPAMLFNFCKDRFETGTFFNRFRSECLAAVVLGFMAFGMWCFGLYQDMSALEQQISRIRATAAGIFQDTFPDRSIPEGLSPLLLMQAQVKQALDNKGANPRVPETENEFEVPAVDVLHALSSQIPDSLDARLNRLLLSRGQVTIAGSTDSFNTVDRLKSALEKSALFKTVTINSAEAAKNGSRILFQFNISL